VNKIPLGPCKTRAVLLTVTESKRVLVTTPIPCAIPPSTEPEDRRVAKE
jgi:hypothetical protein